MQSDNFKIKYHPASGFSTIQSKVLQSESKTRPFKNELKKSSLQINQ